jgi:hypothetical protein
MYMKNFFLAAFVVTTLLTSCSNSKKMNINGTYSTDFGDLVLKEDQKKVTGTYTYPGPDGMSATGNLTGDLVDKVLNFKWEQKQGETKAEGSGTFTFAENGKSFTGSWSDSKGGTGQWNGTKK